MSHNNELFDLRLSEKFEPTLELVKQFIADEIIPLEDEFHKNHNVDDIWRFSERQNEILEGLKAKAKGLGLWNFFLPEWNGGEGTTNLDYAYLAQEMGKSFLAPEVFNCAAPDTGNMEVLAQYGTPAQQKQWLEPLMEGTIRSAFAMTEPDRACSDATNIAATAVLDGDEWVINGEKHYISGAGDARCKVLIVMLQTDPDAPRKQRQSQILVPMDTPGLEVIEGLQVLGDYDAPHGHMHLRFTNCRVPKDNILLGVGRGFEISQGRLGPGRIHHCMRAIGQAEKALELLIKRGLSREAFGKKLIDLGGNIDLVAKSRMDIDASRLMVFQTAKAMDTLSKDEARIYISSIKASVPIICCDIIDRAIQMYGALGVSQNTPLAAMYGNARMLRLADGPDEVHRMVVAKAEIRKYL